MIKLRVKDILDATGGSLIAGNRDSFINGISTDSRGIKKGELFFALKGPRFDGNKFVRDALSKGASGAVVSAPVSDLQSQNPRLGFPLIHVQDTLTALGDLAGYWRKMHPVPLIAVSGSCGKTTTKEMIASILKVSRCIVKTEGNLNNLIGLPLTLFSLNNIHEAAVVELGISKKGEMKRLAEICSPDVAVLTNIGESHIETLGSIDGVASEKCELLYNMNNSGTAVINIDDPWLMKMERDIKTKKVTFSLKYKTAPGAEADVMLKEIVNNTQDAGGSAAISASFIAMGMEIPVKLKYTGMHNLYNAAAAIAATLSLDVTKDEITEGLCSAEPVHSRMEILTSGRGIRIIDDTYNANPMSMEASLKMLANMRGRKVAVLGDMLELGDMAKDAHCRIGRLVQDMGVSMLFVIGSFSGDIAYGAKDAGMAGDRIHTAKDKNEIITILTDTLKEGDNVLIKGSRVMAMEEIVKGLIAN